MICRPVGGLAVPGLPVQGGLAVPGLPVPASAIHPAPLATVPQPGPQPGGLKALRPLLWPGQQQPGDKIILSLVVDTGQLASEGEALRSGAEQSGETLEE